MAYNNINLLKRIIEIQNIYLKENGNGKTGIWIFNNIIYPNYHISKSTFDSYLARNAKKELKEKLKN